MRLPYEEEEIFIVATGRGKIAKNGKTFFLQTTIEREGFSDLSLSLFVAGNKKKDEIVSKITGI